MQGIFYVVYIKTMLRMFERIFFFEHFVDDPAIHAFKGTFFPIIVFFTEFCPKIVTSNEIIKKKKLFAAV